MNCFITFLNVQERSKTFRNVQKSVVRSDRYCISMTWIVRLIYFKEFIEFKEFICYVILYRDLNVSLIIAVDFSIAVSIYVEWM